MALTAVLVGSGTTSCGSSSDSPPEPACVRDRTPFSLGADNYADVGKLGDAKGNGRPFVVVYDEQHLSRIGQVEIAIMLNRLYHTANLRHLALEGTVVEKPAPDLTWFRSLPAESIRGAVALQLLRQGEVSAAEFVAMVLPDFQLHPIERDNEYQVGLSDGAADSYTAYLVAIAWTSMTPDQRARADELSAQGKLAEAIRSIVDDNEWTRPRYALLQQTTPPASTGDMQKLGTELEEKARDVKADIEEFRSDLEGARRFFDTTTQRSGTMAAKTADLAAARVGDCAPIAMNIGAAHTAQVRDQLDQRHVSYAVVSPQSLSSDSDGGTLSTDAFNRKANGQSVDPPGSLGALVGGHRKPPPSSQTAWFKTKAILSFAAVDIARAVPRGAGGGKPPYDLDAQKLGLGGSGGEPLDITINLSTIIEVPNHDNSGKDVIFEVTLHRPVTTFWMRVGVVPTPDKPVSTDQETLEKALMQTRDELKTERPSPDPPEKPPVAIVTLAPNVKAAIAGNPEDLKGVNLY
ncbi:MAG: hypothetical protein ACJ72N_02295 [Labedaea sp.]